MMARLTLSAGMFAAVPVRAGWIRCPQAVELVVAWLLRRRAARRNRGISARYPAC
jgi:hypothetical protein